MLNDNITPEAVDSLLADLTAMLEVESIAPERMPAARMAVDGTVRRVEIHVAGSFAIVDSGKSGSAYAFEVSDFLAGIRQISDGPETVTVVEFDGGRCMTIERHADRLHFWMSSTAFSVKVDSFLCCAGRAGLGVSA